MGSGSRPSPLPKRLETTGSRRWPRTEEERPRLFGIAIAMATTTFFSAAPKTEIGAPKSRYPPRRTLRPIRARRLMRPVESGLRGNAAALAGGRTRDTRFDRIPPGRNWAGRERFGCAAL